MLREREREREGGGSKYAVNYGYFVHFDIVVINSFKLAKIKQ